MRKSGQYCSATIVNGVSGTGAVLFKMLARSNVRTFPPSSMTTLPAFAFAAFSSRIFAPVPPPLSDFETCSAGAFANAKIASSMSVAAACSDPAFHTPGAVPFLKTIDANPPKSNVPCAGSSASSHESRCWPIIAVDERNMQRRRAAVGARFRLHLHIERGRVIRSRRSPSPTPSSRAATGARATDGG